MKKTSSLRVRALRTIHAISAAANALPDEEDFIALVVRSVPVGLSSTTPWIVDVQMADVWSDSPGAVELTESINEPVSEPITVEGRVCGAIRVRPTAQLADANPASLAPDGRSFLKEVAGILGVFYERRLRDERLALAAMRNKALMEMTAHALGQPDEDLLRFALEQAERLTGSKIAYAHFINQDQESISLGIWSTGTLEHCEAVHDSHYPVSQAGVWADCLRERQAVVHNDYPSLAHRRGLPEGHVTLLRHLGVPVIERDRVVMVVGVGNKALPYDGFDQEFVQKIASNCWSLLQRNRFATALQRSNQALRTISECTAAIVRASDEPTLLQDICRTAVEAGGYARVWVGQPEDGPGDESVRLAIRERRTVVTRGSRLDADWGPWLEGVRQKEDYEASVSLPLILEGKCDIALVVHSVEADAFDEEEVALLAGLAKDLSFGLVALRSRAERDHAQTVLRQTMDDYKSLLDSSPVVVYRLLVVGGEVVTKMVSTNIAWTLGYDVGEAYSVTWWTSHLHPDDRDTARATFGRIFSEGTVTHEYRFAHKDGRYVWIRDEVRLIRDEQGNPAEIVGAWSDVTETKRMSDALLQTNADLVREHDALRKTLDELARAQSQLLQSEKMAAVGQLAAGVAHEINNPVGFVSSNLNTLKTYAGQLLDTLQADRQALAQLAPDHPVRRGIEQAHQAADVAFLQQDIPDLLRESAEGLDRVRKIVADLKNFSHVDEQEWQEADLNKGLESTLNVAWNELKYKATVVREFGELPLVRCIPAQINQVFLNLLINAGQAIETKGTITLRTGHDDAFAWVEIADTGKGIPHDIQERIFEPFFTTKPVGKGTGLGLSISWDIIQRHKGSIRVASEPGLGSVFRIQLPLK